MQHQQTGGSLYPEAGQASSAPDEDTGIASMIAKLTEWFERHADLRCFVAVDPSQRDLISDDYEENALFDGLRRAAVVIDHDAFPEAYRPYLLELDLSTPLGRAALARTVAISFEDRRPDSMAQGLGQRVGGWLASSALLEEVASHWSRIVLQRDDKGAVCLLRFYDPRALALLWTILSPAQRQAVLGPLTAWHALDAAAMPSVYLASTNARASFMLSTAQWQQIHRHGLVNRTLALHAQACQRQPTYKEVEVAVAAAMRADQYKLSDRDDTIAFIGHALAWHPEFDAHPKVAHLLGIRAQDDFYTAEIAQLSVEDINEIRQGGWYERMGFKASR